MMDFRQNRSFFMPSPLSLGHGCALSVAFSGSLVTSSVLAWHADRPSYSITKLTSPFSGGECTP
jgi:hypothetical protein